MKYTPWVFLGVLFLPHLAFADVKISEVAWMGTSKSQYSEWIELYNTGEEAVSLAGWKLYKAGSDTLYTLSKTVAPHAYLLVERTTASAPDAAPDINDESGAFGASGLRNTGEDLSLKDEKGTVIDSLSFSAGWPAGDAESGKTMQWDGNAWITADGTPGAVNATATDVIPETPAAENSENESTSAGSGTASASSAKTVAAKPKVVVPPKPSLSVAIPKSVLQGVADEYTAAFEYADILRGPQGYFYWNMGDGMTYVQPALVPISHTYQYPGTYTVSVSYYPSPVASRPVLQASAAASVSEPLATVESINGGAALKIANNTSKSMDIGHWPISMTEGIRSLPELTTVAAKSAIAISAQRLGVRIVTAPALATPNGTPVRSSSK